MKNLTTGDYSLCEDLEKNIADEAEARLGYYQILRRYSNFLSISEIEQIEDIIAEELKHSEILHAIIERRTGIKPEL